MQAQLREADCQVRASTVFSIAVYVAIALSIGFMTPGFGQSKSNGVESNSVGQPKTQAPVKVAFPAAKKPESTWKLQPLTDLPQLPSFPSFPGKVKVLPGFVQPDVGGAPCYTLRYLSAHPPGEILSWYSQSLSASGWKVTTTKDTLKATGAKGSTSFITIQSASGDKTQKSSVLIVLQLYQ